MNFLRYWKENFRIADGWYKFIGFILSGISWLIFFVCKVAELRTPNADIVASLSWIAGLLFLAIGLLWVPFRRHEKEKLRHEEEIKSLKAEQTELKKLLDERNDLKEAVLTKRKTKDELSRLLGQIEKRIIKISGMGNNDYSKILGTNNCDVESWSLIENIKNFILVNVGNAEADLFSSTIGELPDNRSYARQIDMLSGSNIHHLQNKALKLQQTIREFK